MPPDDLQTHDVVRRMFGRDALYLALWAVQLVGAAALTPVISRVLGVGAFGLVAAVNAVMQVLFLVTGLGLNGALQRAYAREQDGHDSALRLLGAMLVASAVLTGLVLLTGPSWAPALGFDGFPKALQLAIAWGGLSSVTNGCLSLLRSQDRLAGFVWVSLVQSVVAEVLALLLAVFVEPTAAMFVLGQTLAQLAALLTGLALLRPRPLGRRHLTLVRQALTYGLPLVPATLGGLALAAADRLVIQDRLGQSAVARYQIAYNVGAMPMLLLGVLNGAWMPRIFALSTARDRATVLLASRDALHRILCPVVVGLSLGAPVVLRVWAPQSYRPDTLQVVVALVIVSAVPFTAGLSLNRQLLAEGRSGRVAVVTSVAAVVNIGLNLALVPHLGLTGSALATLLAYGLLHLLLLQCVPAGRRLPRPATRLALLLAVSVGGAMAVSAAPIDLPLLLVRGLLAAGCLGWFGAVAAEVSGRRTGRARA